MNLLVLSHLVDDPEWTERIERTLRLFGARLEQMGRAVPMMAAALSTYVAGLQQIVIVEATSGRSRRLAERWPDVSAVRVTFASTRTPGRAGVASAVHRRDDAGERTRRGLRLPRLHLPPAGDAAEALEQELRATA